MSAIPSWAVKGRKVVCVDSVPGEGVWRGDGPVEGRIYTIWRVVVAADGLVDLHLKEIQRSPTARARWGQDVGYHISRFRPVHTLESDLSEHFSVLLDVKQPSPVEA